MIKVKRRHSLESRGSLRVGANLTEMAREERLSFLLLLLLFVLTPRRGREGERQNLGTNCVHSVCMHAYAYLHMIKVRVCVAERKIERERGGRNERER